MYIEEWDLIETYWNVNSITFSNKFDFVLDLIETYWNVNP